MTSDVGDQGSPLIARVRLGSDPWPQSLTTLVAEVAGVLGGAPAGRRVVVLLEEQPSEPERAGAVREALRSLVHAIALEQPTAGANLVVGGDRADQENAVGYLTSQTSAFVLGATVDLRAPA